MNKPKILQELHTLLLSWEKYRYLNDSTKIVKSKVTADALSQNPQLLELLLSNKILKNEFFTQINNIYVFDKIEFTRILNIKEYMDNSHTVFKNKIGLMDSETETFLSAQNEIVLAFPFKDTVFHGEQSVDEQKSKEILYHERLRAEEIDRLIEPKAFNSFIKYSSNQHEIIEQIPEKISQKDNFIIKGNNLEALYSLKKTYANKIKCIYIDPPYNTGNDSFNYNDNYNHSTWLTFMKNRLEIARELLKDDGSIWISIDDNECHYLKVLCDEVFGRENFLNTITCHRKRGKDNSSRYFSITHDFIVCYAKNKNLFSLNRVELDLKTLKSYKNHDNDPRGVYRELGLWSREQGGSEFDYTTKKGTYYSSRLWLVNKESMKRLDNENKLIEKGDKLYYKLFLTDNQGSIPETIWLDVSNNANAKDQIKDIFDESVFSTPKPIELITKVLKISTSKNDIILDFFAGSGTTGHAVLELNRQDNGNRKFILVEQMDYAKTITAERIKRVMQRYADENPMLQPDESFVYCELAPLNQKYLEQIQQANHIEEFSKIIHEIKQNPNLSMIDYRIDLNEVIHLLESDSFKDLTLQEQKANLIPILDKNMNYIPYSEIDDQNYDFCDEIKRLNNQFYQQKIGE